MLWYLIAHAHGDLSFDADGKRLSDSPHPCVEGVRSLADFLLHSIEIQVYVLL